VLLSACYLANLCSTPNDEMSSGSSKGCERIVVGSNGLREKWRILEQAKWVSGSTLHEEMVYLPDKVASQLLTLCRALG